MNSYLEFEKPVAQLDERISELRSAAEGDDVDITAELKRLERKSASLLASTYASLSPWQKTQVARHPQRPHFCDFVSHAFDEFVPLGGDRYFGEDEAIMGGFATLNGRRLMLIGHEKGNDTESRLRHNFGMGKPEGYRKAIRLMEMAGRFGLPVVTLVDTSGAFPGVEAEERGQAEAMAMHVANSNERAFATAGTHSASSIVKQTTPSVTRNAPISLPALVCGLTSPYPMVTSVIVAQ